jgi:hypothetical protein
MLTEHQNITLPLPAHLWEYAQARAGGRAPQDFIADLLRQEMAREAEMESFVRTTRQAYADMAQGRYIRSSGDAETDLAAFEERERTGWA